MGDGRWHGGRLAEIVVWDYVQTGTMGDDMEDQSQPNEKELAVSSEKPGAESVLDPVERQASWQKHVMVLLWISIALLMVFVGILLYAKYHGLFESPSDQVAPFPSGSAGS